MYTKCDVPHDGEGGHVERNADAHLEFVALDSTSAPDNIARP